MSLGIDLAGILTYPKSPSRSEYSCWDAVLSCRLCRLGELKSRCYSGSVLSVTSPCFVAIVIIYIDRSEAVDSPQVTRESLSVPDEMRQSGQLQRKRAGRPLTFDRESALRKAMTVFWKYGYEPTAISDLTAALNITPPSLYAAFGNKEALFLEGLELYSSEANQTIGEIYEQAATAKEAVYNFMLAAAKLYTDPKFPGGCFVLTAATNCSANSGHIQAAVRQYRDLAEAQMRKRIALDKKAGILPRNVNPAELAAFYYGVTRGMSSMARDGASRSKLLGVINTAMKVWP
jgi:AcrR family transcriptional regulator